METFVSTKIRLNFLRKKDENQVFHIFFIILIFEFFYS